MAIDADLNTGAIDDKEAKRQRDKIQLESSFFGSMDGAVKYVKGDAVAGLLLGRPAGHGDGASDSVAACL